MKKMGIFLAFNPWQPIQNQGIGRLIIFILNSVIKNDEIQVVITLPHWYKKKLTHFLNEEKIDIDKIVILTTTPLTPINCMTVSLQLLRQIPSTINEFIAYLKNRISNATSMYYFMWIILLPLAILLSPLIVCVLLIHPIHTFLKQCYSKIGHHIPHRIKCWIQMKIVRPLQNGFYRPLRGLYKNRYFKKIYNFIRYHELNKLTTLMNKQMDIPVWFVPCLFWPEIQSIRAKKVVAVPDIIWVDYPNELPKHSSNIIRKNIQQSLDSADQLICYSEHVKQKHLIENLGINANKISIIPHGATNLQHYFTNNTNPSYNQRNISLDLLDKYRQNHFQENAYLKNFDFNDMRYIFYSSQLRSYKNFFNFIKAYEILLRKRFVNIKLILTADITQHDEIYNYILAKRLQYDILTFCNVPSPILAALNHLAICAVNPTLFEGGFPFTFTEAYSVGTPSVMSRIPMVCTVINQKSLQDRMLFDPHNINDIADKIEFAIKHRNELYQEQAIIYNQLQLRSWEVVAKEYTDLFNHVVSEGK